MTVWIAITLLLAFGLLLMIAEIIFIPGTTIFGIFGLIAALLGLYLCFRNLGYQTGMAVTVAFALVTLLSVYLSFKSEVWQRFALTQTISSRVNDEHKFLLRVGDQGKTLSALRPSGKAVFQGGEIEVQSLGNFIDVGCQIKVASIVANQVYVEQV